MNIYLVRHGHTDWNEKKRIQGSTDTELSAKGIQQAHELSEHIKTNTYQFSKIYSSGQKRAYETASILSWGLNLSVEILPGLEEISFGSWEGLTWDEVRATDPDNYNQWFQNRSTTQPPNGESYLELIERVINALDDIVKSNESDVLVVTHSAVIMSVLSLLNQTPLENMTQHRVTNVEMVSIHKDDVFKLMNAMKTSV